MKKVSMLFRNCRLTKHRPTGLRNRIFQTFKEVGASLGQVYHAKRRLR